MIVSWRKAFLIIGCLALTLTLTVAKPALLTSNSIGSTLNKFDKSENEDYPAKYKVTGFTDDSQETYTGYITVNTRTTSKLFYMLHSAQQGTVQNYAPLIIWLNGGPGCSSMFGAINEVGPLRIKSFNKETGKAEYEKNVHTWTKSNHMLFIDSPVGTGYSMSIDDYMPTSATAVADDLHEFLRNFFHYYEELRNVPIYIFGESYGGKYAPALAHKILNNLELVPMNLVGIGMGDPWTDPLNQIGYYDYIAYAAGLVGPWSRIRLTTMQNQAFMAILNGNLPNASTTFDQCTEYIKNCSRGISEYNFREYNKDYDGQLPAFLNHETTKKMFNVPTHLNYTVCNEAIYQRFKNDISRSYAPQLQMLAGKIKVLIYQGQDDVIVNTPGVINMINNLDLPYEVDIRTVKKHMWKEMNKVVGWVQTKGNFYFAVVNQAGHMVPIDKAREAKDMLDHYLNDDTDWSSGGAPATA